MTKCWCRNCRKERTEKARVALDLTCWFCFKGIDTQERDGAWAVLFNGEPAHLQCFPRPIEELVR